MSLFRTIFEPWERNPGMLTAYFRARASPRGQQLLRRGLDIVAPAGLELMADVDDEFVADLNTVLSSVVYGLLGRFVAGEIETTDILPAFDRTVYWLTVGYESTKALQRPRSSVGQLVVQLATSAPAGSPRASGCCPRPPSAPRRSPPRSPGARVHRRAHRGVR